MGRVVFQQEFLPITDTPRPSSWVPLPQKPQRCREHPPAHPSQGPRVSSRAVPSDGPVSGGGLQSQVPRLPGPDDNVASCQDGPSRCGSPPCSAAAAQPKAGETQSRRVGLSSSPGDRRGRATPTLPLTVSCAPAASAAPSGPPVPGGGGVGPGQCSGGDVASYTGLGPALTRAPTLPRGPLRQLGP